MELNAQIKKYRTELNLSQEELAEKVYVTRQTLSNWKNGKSYPVVKVKNWMKFKGWLKQESVRTR